MPIVDYPFLPCAPGHKMRPALVTKITNPDTGLSASVVAMIDTGADGFVIPKTMAALLGFDPDQQVAKMITANGISVVGRGEINLEVYNTTITVPPDIVKAGVKASFLPGLQYVLWGGNSFDTRERLSIDYQKQIFSISFPDYVKVETGAAPY